MMSFNITSKVAIAILGFMTAAVSAQSPIIIPVDAVCNQPNNEISIFPEMTSPGIPAPAKAVTLQADCCYERDYNLGNQVCACKAWDAWCAGRHSNCCGEARACTEYCTCIPPERFCDHPESEFDAVCDDPYAGQDDGAWAMDLGMNEAPGCPKKQ